MYRHKGDFDFPAIENMKNRKTPDSLPTVQQIQSAVENAQEVARAELAKVGIENANLKPAMFRTRQTLDTIVQDQAEDIENDEDECEEEDEVAEEEGTTQEEGTSDEICINNLTLNVTEDNLSELNFDQIHDDPEHGLLEPEFVEVEDKYNLGPEGNITEEVYELDELFPDCDGTLNLKSSTSGSRHTFHVRDRSGNIKIIKKQTLLWMMTDGRYRLSTDRLRRFQQREFDQVML